MRSPWKTWLATLLLVASTMFGDGAMGQTAGDPALTEAIEIYQNGGYPEAAARLDALLYPLRLNTSEDILQARVHLALSYHILGRVKQSSAEFMRALDQDPDLELDPLYVPPEILAFFAETKKTHQETRPTPSTVPSPTPTVVPAPEERMESVLDLAPLGIAQFRAGRPVHGGLLLSGEIFLGAVSTGTWLWLGNKQDEIDARDPPLFDDAQEAAVFTWVKRANNVAFFSTAALLAYGLGDAVWRTSARHNAVRLAPGAPGTQVGMQLTWEF